jgi:N-acetylglutamate synthase-like GNAT family acetyltransferase
MKEIDSIEMDSRIRTLLSYATSKEKVDEEYKKYACLLNRKLYSTEVDGEIISCIGVEFHDFKEAIITHIAVLPKNRGHGIGSSMITFILREHAVNVISAETDKDAVHFYAKFGFEIKSLGEKYPGIERFSCEFRTE